MQAHLSEVPGADNGRWHNDEGVDLPVGHGPEPTAWRIIVLPKAPVTKSKGGIILVDESVDAQNTLNVVGKILRVGPHAFRNVKLGYYDKLGTQLAEHPIPGDWITFSRYTGMKFSWRGIRLVQLNDDEVLSKLEKADDVKGYV